MTCSRWAFSKTGQWTELFNISLRVRGTWYCLDSVVSWHSSSWRHHDMKEPSVLLVLFFVPSMDKLSVIYWSCWWFETPQGTCYVIVMQSASKVLCMFTRCKLFTISWWRHQMETFSALLALCAGNSPVSGEFPTQRPMTRSFDVFFDLRLNKRLSKQPRGRWFETLSWSLWRHRNVYSTAVIHVLYVRIYRGHFSSYNSQKHGRGKRCRSLEQIWPKFYHWKCCFVCTFASYITVLYRESIVLDKISDTLFCKLSGILVAMSFWFRISGSTPGQ